MVEPRGSTDPWVAIAFQQARLFALAFVFTQVVGDKGHRQQSFWTLIGHNMWDKVQKVPTDGMTLSCEVAFASLVRTLSSARANGTNWAVRDSTKWKNLTVQVGNF
ncbi:hypothetical protein OIV83_005555 [Microbotryomycetes sp. JL201]|nr:hypothetical protein OIV83_005555 [Microbotryomycetes sp. JL201]